MKSADALTQFLKDCEDRGITPATRQTYWYRLHHFTEENPELPTDTRAIEQFLQKRGETPKHRGKVFDTLQAFYSYLERARGIKSPVPSKGPMGRPRKKDSLAMSRYGEGDGAPPTETEILRQGGSHRIEVHIFIHLRRR